jgi:LPXTG-motif cell wall-anchored protein
LPPRTNFPGTGPDQTLFFMLLGIGFALGVLGYLVGSRTLRAAGIVTMFVATAIFVGDVFSSGG